MQLISVYKIRNFFTSSLLTEQFYCLRIKHSLDCKNTMCTFQISSHKNCVLHDNRKNFVIVGYALFICVTLTSRVTLGYIKEEVTLSFMENARSNSLVL